MELESLSKNYIKAVYGHSYTVREIQKKFPYSNKQYKRIDTRGFISTVNPLVAMQYRLDNKPIVEWGARVAKTKNIFVFKSNEKQYSPIECWQTE